MNWSTVVLSWIAAMWTEQAKIYLPNKIKHCIKHKRKQPIDLLTSLLISCPTFLFTCVSITNECVCVAPLKVWVSSMYTSSSNAMELHENSHCTPYTPKTLYAWSSQYLSLALSVSDHNVCGTIAWRRRVKKSYPHAYLCGWLYESSLWSRNWLWKYKCTMAGRRCRVELSFSGESDWSCHRDTVLYCQDCCLQPRLRSLPSEKGGHGGVLELVFSSI